ncbi:hypothetical protein MKR64_16080 [Acinetobacter baumannii]
MALRSETTGEESELLARKVGLAAIKFADLDSHRQSGYIFDAERLVSFEGRTGPYVQYACVRISSILKKLRNMVGVREILILLNLLSVN